MPRLARQHYGIPKQRRRRGSSDDRFYDTQPWRRLRRWVQRRKPLCVDPVGLHKNAGEPVPEAVDYHHKVPISEAPNLALVESNIEGLCKACHARITNQER